MRRHNYGSRRPICPKGHIKAIVGIESHGRCSACAKPVKGESAKMLKVWLAKRNPLSLSRSRYMLGLKEDREQLGLSAPDLARRAGVARSTVNKIEAHKVRARPQTRAKLLRAIADIKKEHVE